VADWQPRRGLEAFDGYLNGGILGTLIDCHSNWTAIAALLGRSGAATAPSTVTAELAIRFRHPTPSNRPIRLIGRATDVDERRVTVETAIESDSTVTATGVATFVVVGPDHPAFGRW